MKIKISHGGAQLRELLDIARKLLSNQGIIMAREDELQADLDKANAGITLLAKEVGELRDSGNSVVQRLREQVAAEQAKNAALQAQLDAALAGSVSDAKAADLAAQADAAAATAAASAADADAAEAEWDAIAQPEPPPVA